LYLEIQTYGFPYCSASDTDTDWERQLLTNSPPLSPGDLMCLLYEENADRDSYVLSLFGDVDISNVGEFEAALSGAIKAPGTVVLDLTHLHFIDVAGMRVLERQATLLSDAGDRLILSSPPAFLERMLEVLELDELMEVAA
jgi:anti-sigma B factor antagonist